MAGAERAARSTIRDRRARSLHRLVRLSGFHFDYGRHFVILVRNWLGIKIQSMAPPRGVPRLLLNWFGYLPQYTLKKIRSRIDDEAWVCNRIVLPNV